MSAVAARTSLARVAALGMAAGLVACSTPMPSPPPPPAPPPAAAPGDAAVPPPVAPAPVESPARPPSAIDARFPEPLVSYRTPAFQPGRSTVTTPAEARAFMQALARDHAALARLVKVGEAAGGAPIEALVFSRSAQSTPESLRASGRATVLLYGPQRADAPAATEALLALSQELAAGRLQRLLDRVNVIVWPELPPLEATALDGDHLRLATPQAQALALLVREYQPLVVAEASEYLPASAFALRYTAVERHDAMLQYAATANMAPFITKAAEEWFREPMVGALRQQGLTADWHYAVPADAVERRLAMGSPRADNSRNVQGLKNMVSLQIESRGEPGGGRTHLKRRVHTLVTGLWAVLQSAAERGNDLHKLRQYVDAEVASQACKGAVVVEAALTPGEYTLQMLDPATGAERSMTVTWDTALALREVHTRPRPCGYWLAATELPAVSRLRALGVRVEQVQSKGVVQGDLYAGENARQVKTQPALLDLAPGGYYVTLAQPLAHVAVAALEPDTAHSYVAVGLVSGLDKVARVMSWPGVKLAAMP